MRPKQWETKCVKEGGRMTDGVDREACEGERKEITLKGSNRVKDTIKEGESERLRVVKATMIKRIERKADGERSRDPSRQDTASFLSSVCTPTSPDSPDISCGDRGETWLGKLSALFKLSGSHKTPQRSDYLPQ